MFSQFCSLSFISAFLFLISSIAFTQNESIIFEDDFESFTAGEQLVCQDSLNWNTWSLHPCGIVEDPLITNSIAYSGSNSVWIQQNNDLIKTIPNYTSGEISISFQMYIPTDFMASWGQLASFIRPDSTEWGFYAKFNPFGNGEISAGGMGAAQFSFAYDTWMHNELIVDLDNDWAEYYFEGNLVYGWQWTLGSAGDTVSLQLSYTDIMGSNWPNPGLSEWYIDDYVMDLITDVEDEEMQVRSFTLYQNYPNPFNPTTTIEYQIPELSFVSIKIYDVLGNEITTLVNTEKSVGSYKVEFDAVNLPSGVYFYQLKVGSFVQTKKMLLIR